MKLAAVGMIVLMVIYPSMCSGDDQPTHPLKVFIEENARSPERVTEVQSSTAKRWGKVFLGIAVGVVAGYAHARVTGGDVGKEMAIGGLAGGAVAFTITRIQDRRLASREEVATRVAYDPSQGYRSGVQEVTITPNAVAAGGKITVKTSYWALGPTPSEAIGMSRYAGIAFSGTYLKGFSFKPDPMQFGNGGGQFETTIEIKLPPQVNPGTYSIVWLVDGHAVGADRETTFVVNG